MYVSKWIALRTRVVELCLKIYRLLCAAKQNPFGCNFSGNPSYSSTLLVKYMLLLMGGGPGIENMIELKQCLGYTVWISTHVTDGIAGCQDNWALIRPPSHPHHNGGGGGGVDNSTQGTMCCAPLKLVPRVKRTQGPSDGDTLIRHSQVFYHPVTLKQISFRGGMRCVHVGEYFQSDMCTGAFSLQACGCHWKYYTGRAFSQFFQLKCKKI